MIEYVIIALSFYNSPITTLTSYVIYNKLVYGKLF